MTSFQMRRRFHLRLRSRMRKFENYNFSPSYAPPLPPVTFGKSWRVKHNPGNDTMELQSYESGEWVPKFTFTL